MDQHLRKTWEKEAHADPAKGTNPDGIGFSATGIEAMVCQEIAMRQQMGLRKYGTTVMGNPLTTRQWLQHALEESLDLAVYLKKIIHEIDRTTLDNRGTQDCP